MPVRSAASRGGSRRAPWVGGFGAHWRRAMTATAVLGVALALLVSFTSAVRFTYHAPSLHVFIETTAGLVSLLAALLVFGRFRQSSRLDDLVLACGLALLSAATLWFAALPAASGLETGASAAWAPIIGRKLGAVMLACAAFSPPVRLRAARRWALIFFAGAAFLLTMTAAVVAVFAGHLPAGVDPALAAHDARGRPLMMSGSPVLLAVKLLSAAMYAVAAIGFTRRAERTGDELFRWFAVGSLLASVAMVHYFLFPSRYSRWVFTGDFILLIAYLVIAAGAAREIGRYWRSVAAMAVLEERRRIARDLHDGLAQELAFILRRVKREREGLVSDPQVRAAAERAIADARRSIAALTRPLDEPLDVALAQAVEEVAGRYEQNLVLDLAPDVRVTPATREELIRIAREAVTNAARHGGAATVRVELSNGRSVRLKVADDGIGFEPNATERTERFGLISMRERARALDADFRLTSVPGNGTEIELILP